jgi:hypothetical protein
MLGHKLPGVRSHYMKPDIETLLEGTKEVKGYVAAINDLTINDENRLQKKVEELKQQDDYQRYIIDKKMNEKEEQIKILMAKVEKLSEKEQEFIEIKQEGRIISKEMNQKFIDLEKKFNAWVVLNEKQRKLDRDFELETEPEVKDQKFDKMISATRETIRKRGELEKHLLQQEQKQNK